MDGGAEGGPPSQLPEAWRPSSAGRQLFVSANMEENGYCLQTEPQFSTRLVLDVHNN